MSFITIQEAKEKGEGKVQLRGWVYRERGSAKVKFVVLRDGTGILQCVIKPDVVGEDKFKIADKLQIEASMQLEGEIHKDERAPGGYELQVKSFEVIGESHEYPIQKDQSTEFLMDQRHLWIRSQKLQAMMKVKAKVMSAWREFYDKQGFVEFTPPIFQPSQCEGGSTLFEVKYYDKVTYLTQSWQLYAEAAIFSYEKLYCISPCFRAEKSKTSRHLSEFWMAEMEQAWIELPELVDSIEGCIKHIVKRVLEDCQESLEILERDLSKLKPAADKPFKRMKYAEALELLKKHGMDVPWGKDLRTVEEDEIVKHFDTPVIVTHYPEEAMAFYKPPVKEDGKSVCLCVDVLAPEGYGEIVGGSQRDLDTKRMMKALEEEGEDPSSYDWYFDLRKYGSVPHSGYGLGVERVVAWICGLDTIKDAIPFPRTMLRWKP